MKHYTGYKWVRCEDGTLRSYLGFPRVPWEYYYTPGAWTVPEHGDGPLCVFADLGAAQQWHRSLQRWAAIARRYQLWRVSYIRTRRPRGRRAIGQRLHRRIWWIELDQVPDGTDWASAVRLEEPVES